MTIVEGHKFLRATRDEPGICVQTDVTLFFLLGCY
jgi:hypothetical protein